MEEHTEVENGSIDFNLSNTKYSGYNHFNSKGEI